MSKEKKLQRGSSPPPKKPDVPLKDLAEKSKDEPESAMGAPTSDKPEGNGTLAVEPSLLGDVEDALLEDRIHDLLEERAGMRIRRPPRRTDPPPPMSEPVSPERCLFASDEPEIIPVEERLRDVEEMLTGRRIRERTMPQKTGPLPPRNIGSVPPGQPLFRADESDPFSHRESESVERNLDELMEEGRHRPLEDSFEGEAMTAEAIAEGIRARKEHRTDVLTENEISALEDLLPEGQKRWIMPIPEETAEAHILVVLEEETEEAHIRAVLECEPKTRIELGRGRYYIMEHGVFEWSQRCARVGNKLHIWPDEMTSYGFLRKIGADVTEYGEVSWDIPLVYKLTKDEGSRYEFQLPDQGAVLIHPVPDRDTKNEKDREILSAYAHIRQIELDGKRYYLFSMGSVEEWRGVVCDLPKARIAFMKEDGLHTLHEEKNGSALFRLGDNRRQRGTLDMPPLPPRGLVIPEENELRHAERVFEGCLRRHLYPLSAAMERIDADTLKDVIESSMHYIDNRGHSPLLLLSGRWYIAFDYPFPGSIKASFEDGKVRVHGTVGEGSS